MINLRRFPGVFFRYKKEIGVLFLLILSGIYVYQAWNLVCTNNEIRIEIDKQCRLYKAGVAVGNLCSPLCDTKELHSISCISKRSKKQFVFVAKWNKKLIVIKSSRRTERLNSYPGGKNLPLETDLNGDEKDFEQTIRKVVSERLNVTLTNAQLDDLRFLENKNQYSDLDKRRIEKENILSLLQSQEYLLLKLFSDRDVFPQIQGTCGHFYGVEYLERPKYNSLFTLDDKAEWSERMKLAVAIMDFVEEVETNFPDALYLCDVQTHHLGITPQGRVKFLDLDLVYMKNVMDKILKSGEKCHKHQDCDFIDCKSKCNLKDHVCDSGITNDNLQTICEKIFIGWTMGGKMIVPGLLMSEYTPASLSALLRLCAENRRQPVHEDLRQRLYTTLTEMHHILLQKVSD